MKKKSKFLTGLIVLIILLVVDFVVATLIAGDGEFSFNTEVFTSPVFIGIGVIALIIVLYPSLKNMFSFGGGSGDREAGEGRTKTGDKVSQYYDARWISENELRTLPKFRYNTWDTIKNEKKDGIVIRSLLQKNKLEINFTKSIHTMIVGTTGSGKTTLYIEPTIRIFSKMAAKPCMVITDPKGELFENHSIQLQEAGYRLMVLDLRNPYASTKWNPIENAYDNYHKALKLEELVKIHKNDNPATYKLKTISDTYGKEWYEFEGVAYHDRQILDTDIAAKKQQLVDDSENELREIAATIVPIESKNDSTWEMGAQDFLYALMLGMLEDSKDPEITGMAKEKFNFYNLGKMATLKDPDPDNPFQSLREYCQGRDTFSKVMSLAGTVINNAPNTAKSYMGVLAPKIAIFQDGGICQATSKNEMYFDDFTDKPTAFFIKVPDEKESRHCIATMCISQIYKKLIEKASKCPGLTLPRPVHFLLDEFANLPKIPKIDSLITVGRSRQIYFHLVVQSYSQLDNKYTKEVADTIRGNCNVQIFIGTEDQKTREDFSKMCGDVSLETQTKSTSKNEKQDNSENKTTNTQIVTRPLIYPYELGQLPYGTVIVKIFQENPIKTPFTQWFKCPQFDKRKASEKYVPATPLDHAKIFYDIRERNKRVLKKGNRRPSFDDFDF